MTCQCGHSDGEHETIGPAACTVCLCPGYWPTGLLTPRTLYAAAGVIEGGGVLVLAFTSWPVLVPVGMFALGLLMQWRAGVAKREALFRLMELPRRQP